MSTRQLFESGKIGKLNIKNRIIMSAMGCGALVEPDGRLSRRGIDYFVARAKGGAGLIVTSVCLVSRTCEPYPINPLVPYLVADNKIYAGWLDDLSEAIHDYGAKVALQLSAGMGRALTPQDLGRLGNRSPVGPSPLSWFADPSIITRELTTEEVESLVEAFEFTAEVVKSAGIDAIELHCHGGYLFDQFQTALWNKRTDKYGGDLEGRLRFLVEIMRRIKKILGSDFPLIVKFGLTHYFEGGRGIEEGLEIARRLGAAGVDALCVDAGSPETPYWLIPSQFQPPGCTVDLAEMVKKVVDIPVVAVGKLGYPPLAESVLQEGKADFIALGRTLLADPEWPNKVKDGRLEDIRPCIGCLEGCRRRVHEGKAISCTVNPTTGKEKEFAIRAAEKKKTVLVIGGGPGGMEAAMVAALKGHKVSLWEKSGALGGNLIPASVPSFKQDYKSLINYLSTQMEKLGVDIRLRQEAIAELVTEVKPEVLLIATGSTPIIPEIPGVEKGNVVTAVDLLLSGKEAGESVVVIGGGLVGCETALYISQKSKKVTIVEMLDSVARDMYSVNRLHLLQLLADANVRILTGTRVTEIMNEGVVTIGKHGERSILEAETIVLALGMKSNSELVRALSDKVPETYSIGDCSEPRKVINAIWEGFRIARLI